MATQEIKIIIEASPEIRQLLELRAQAPEQVGAVAPDGGGAWDVPRVWALPPEPGPQVTAVRDRDDDVWIRVDGGWSMRSGSGTVMSWDNVMLYAPLTEVKP